MFLHADRTVREWFFKNIILTPEILYNFLVDAPAQGIRDFFANVVLIFLRAAREDTLAGVDLSGLGNGAFFVADRTITDCVLRLLTLVPRNRFNEFLRQPQQFFDLINAWVNDPENALDNASFSIGLGYDSALFSACASTTSVLWASC